MSTLSNETVVHGPSAYVKAIRPATKSIKSRMALGLRSFPANASSAPNQQISRTYLQQHKYQTNSKWKLKLETRLTSQNFSEEILR
mmetsp:Transcript_39841/g.158443  ORF Transcript_39841/g.158443 Transcript_39841/m.158443 type:complete len:86 (-) Transcript_39841:3464-3721(-)